MSLAAISFALVPNVGFSASHAPSLGYPTARWRDLPERPVSLAQTPEELRSLLAHTKLCAKLQTTELRKASKANSARKGAPPKLPVLPTREALLAATTLHLQPGDLLIPEPGDAVAAFLAPTAGKEPHKPLPYLGKDQPRLLLSAAMASALKATGSDRIILAYVHESAREPGWADALTWAQAHELPLVLVCADPRGNQAFLPAKHSQEDRFTWDAVEALTRTLMVPVLSADGEDAVAMYRVTEESVLRARAGRGPTVLWAMLPSPRALAKGRQAAAAPVARLQRYLRARKVPLR